MSTKKTCSTCGSGVDLDDAEKCNNCWEVERRLLTYLRAGKQKARDFITEAMLAMSHSRPTGDRPPKPPGPIQLTVEQDGVLICNQALIQVEMSESWDRERLDGGLFLIAGRLR